MRGASTAGTRRATASRVRAAANEAAGTRPAVRSVGIIAVGPNATAALRKVTAATTRMALPAPAAGMDLQCFTTSNLVSSTHKGKESRAEAVLRVRGRGMHTHARRGGPKIQARPRSALVAVRTWPESATARRAKTNFPTVSETEGVRGVKKRMRRAKNLEFVGTVRAKARGASARRAPRTQGQRQG